MNAIEIEGNDKLMGLALDMALSESTGKLGYIGPNVACFHRLALHLACPLLTSDEKHYNKTKDSFGHVTLFQDFRLP